MLVLSIALSGCTVVRIGKQESETKTLQELGILYSSGNYSLEASCTGYITSGQTAVCLYIPVAKRFAEGQTVAVLSVENAALRVDGRYIVGNQVDLTPYIAYAKVMNDGAVLYVRLENPDKWIGSDNKPVINNELLGGTVDIRFTVQDP